MKHPASTAALLLLGLAFLVGGATWLLSGSSADDGQVAQPPVTASSNGIEFVAVTPKEQHKKMNMERTQREFKRIREVGQEVSPDLYMIPDANGDPTYYLTQLIKGIGRNGEPLYLTAQMKKSRTVPLRDSKKYIAPLEANLKPKPMKGVLKVGKPSKGNDGSASTGDTGTNSDASGGAGGGASGESKPPKGG